MATTCDHCCVKISNLGVKLGDTEILTHVNLHINCGEVMAVVGPNGAGKTTLLRTILGEVPYTGDIAFRVSGRENARPDVGYVPQKLQFDLDAPMSVADLVVSAISRQPVWMGVNRRMREKVTTALSKFSAEHLVGRRIGELSGGELQRVLLAIAMTPEPNLLLLDEPGSGVDVKGLGLFYQIVRDLRKKHDISVIMVTHDIGGIGAYADRMVLLNRCVVAEGTADEVLSDKQLIGTFGPSLWNVSCLPGAELTGEGKDGHA